MFLSLCALALLGHVVYATPTHRSPFGNGTTVDALKGCVAQVFGSSANQRIVVSSDDTYTDARLGEPIQFDEFPAVIAFAEKASEVPALINCAKKTGYKAVPRNGGHHFLSYSALNNSLTIDLTHIDYINVSPDLQTATVGAGIRQGALYTALDEHNKTFAGGICPTVGLSGLLGSGGFSMQMRSLGLGVDNVVGAKLVTADGKTITVNAHEHPDLWFAIRGGGGATYGIVIEWTVKLVTLPRSSMVLLNWTDTESQFPVAKRFFEWGPAAPKELGSQINVYKGRVEFVGWYLGGSKEDLQNLMNESGLLKIGKPQVSIGGDCSTDNSRLWGYGINECLPDAQVEPLTSNINTIQQSFAQVGNYPQFTYKEEPKNPDLPAAYPWARFRRMSKSFFVQKSKPVDDDTLKEVINRIRQLDDASNVWGEWHAWNLSNPNTDSAFAWKSQASLHLEFQVHGSEDPATQQKYDQWFKSLESFLRPAVGPASYSGYMDKDISTNHLTSYYGDNVCKLIGIKKQWDPQNFFTNPFAIPTSAPEGIKC